MAAVPPWSAPGFPSKADPTASAQLRLVFL